MELDNPATIYVIDTSSWGKIKGDPAQTQIQGCIFELIDAGKVRMPPVVKTELAASEFIHPWLKPRYREIFDDKINSDVDFLLLVSSVTQAFQAMSGIRLKKTRADPWVVAYAARLNQIDPQGRHYVVCDETLRKRPARKIPTACKRFGVEDLTLMKMLNKEFPYDGWEERESA